MADEQSGADPVPDSFTPAQIRLLRFAVIGMGVIIVFALIAIMARIFYLATGRTSSSHSTSIAAIAAESRIALPAGASVRSIAIAGDRLAVHYEGPAGTGIAVLNLATGEAATRINIVPEVGR